MVSRHGSRLRIAARTVLDGAGIGDSTAVNGCCLTVTKSVAGHLWFDVLEETRRLTSFSQLAAGSLVNLERSLRADTRLGGHFVSGHIDLPGRIEVFEARGKDHYLKVHAPGGFARYLVYKGSVAIDGISLTVASLTVLTDSPRIGMCALIVFLVVGFLILLTAPYPAIDADPAG